MEKQIFDFLAYKPFLGAVLAHGKKAEFAKSIGCQPPFVSQVLGGKPNLSLEQAIKACDFFDFGHLETEYFMLLVHRERAGSQHLQAFFSKQIEHCRERYLKPSSRVDADGLDDENLRRLYYSSWMNALVHVLVSVPEKDQMQYLKSKTGTSGIELKQTLDMLEELELIDRSKSRWAPTRRRIHISEDDPLVIDHHLNVKAFSQRFLMAPKKHDIHFSSYFALSKKDYTHIRSTLLDYISDMDKTIGPSKEETAALFSVDLINI